MNLKKKRLISGIVGGIIVLVAIVGATWWVIRDMVASLGFNPFAG